jgi:hypothetical protein
MLDRRSPEWLFDYRVWQWNGGEVAEKLRFDHPEVDPACWGTIEVPPLVGRTARRRALSEEELAELATKRGVGEPVRQLLLARQHGFRVVRNGGGLNIRRKRRDKAYETVIGAYLHASDAESGLNVGCWREGAGVAEEELPGRPAPRKGHLNTNRYLLTRDEVEALVRLYA